MNPMKTQCSCGCNLERIGEDISEKLDYTPGVFTVEKHIRGKWVCRKCERLIQKAGPAAHHRQRNPDGWAACTGAGGEIFRPCTAVPPGKYLRTRGPRAPRALDTGRMGRRMRAFAYSLWLRP